MDRPHRQQASSESTNAAATDAAPSPKMGARIRRRSNITIIIIMKRSRPLCSVDPLHRVSLSSSSSPWMYQRTRERRLPETSSNDLSVRLVLMVGRLLMGLLSYA